MNLTPLHTEEVVMEQPGRPDIGQSSGLRTLSVTTKDDVILSVETSIDGYLGEDVRGGGGVEGDTSGGRDGGSGGATDLPIVFIHGLGSTKAMLRSVSPITHNIYHISYILESNIFVFINGLLHQSIAHS